MIRKIKQLMDLLGRIEAAEKRGGMLLLTDLTDDLVKRLTDLQDDKTIVIFCNDGTRIEIKSEDNQKWNKKNRMF